MNAKDKDTLDDAETSHRLDRALQRAFSMPHKKHLPNTKKPKVKSDAKKPRA